MLFNKKLLFIVVLNGLKDCFDQALERDDVKAIVVTGISGAT